MLTFGGRLTTAMIHVHKLPQRLQIAKRPTTIVMTVVQKAIWYAQKFHLATRLYTLIAFAAVSPSNSSLLFSYLSLTLLIALCTALSELLVLVGVAPSVEFSLKRSMGSKMKPDCFLLHQSMLLSALSPVQ